MTGLPPPVTHDQQYLQAVHGLLSEQNALLGEIRDRLQSPPPATDVTALAAGAVELREPAIPESADEPVIKPARAAARRPKGRT